jgi:single-strand DNA-binding protein
MSDFSQVVVLGRLTRDPELRYSEEGKPMGSFSLAVNRRFTKESGEAVEQVSFVEVQVYGRAAEIVAQFMKKGRQVLVSGELSESRWADRETGTKRSKLRIRAQSVQFLGRPEGEEAPGGEPPAPPASVPPSGAAPHRKVS